MVWANANALLNKTFDVNVLVTIRKGIWLYEQ